MRLAGIDIGAEHHVVAMLGERGEVLSHPTRFSEDASGYGQLIGFLGAAEGLLVAMEATGHYWQNLFAALVAKGYQVALINPLRTARFAEEDLARTKTDALDALGIARFAREKRLRPARIPDALISELRELVGLRLRLVADVRDQLNALHRLVDLVFPEFTRLVRTLDSELATAILGRYPTARAIAAAPARVLAALRYDGRHRVGPELAARLRHAASTSVGAHQGPAYARGVRYACEDITRLRTRLRELEREIDDVLSSSDLGALLTSIDGVGKTTAAHLIAVLGDPAEFRSAKAIASFIGVVPRLRQSGKRNPQRAPLHHLGHAKLRAALWMPTLAAIRVNTWLRRFYLRLIAAGKPPKLAIVACMRKLLEAVHSVARTRRPFVPRLAA